MVAPARKKSTARKTAAKKAAVKRSATKRTASSKRATTKTAPKTGAGSSVGRLEKAESDTATIEAAWAKHDGNISAVEKETGFQRIKIMRLHERANLKPGERLFQAGLSEEELAKAAAKMRSEGASSEKVWAATGLHGDRQRALFAKYKLDGSKAKRTTSSNGSKTATAKPTSAKKSTTKRTATRSRGRRSRKEAARKA